MSTNNRPSISASKHYIPTDKPDISTKEPDISAKVLVSPHIGAQVLGSAQAVVLLEDRGVRSWHLTWTTAVKHWLAFPQSEREVRVLVIMAEQTDKKAVATLELELSSFAQLHQLTWLPDTQSSLVCESRDFFFGCYFVGGEQETHALRALWADERPPLTLHADSKKLKNLKHPQSTK
eukprot:CAMPEP_0179456952 /NCGR_PEP_ID=MMETSP0799-20121207/40816_1 /TAXON_ID=46947 /ORGANISM="Geminigera cryophila, Strain CCMP2564" /LENGTH=177 /DNA_ID=CAMNT_0021257345 /DNA_START=154 /DNA_END=687 /DNA_ORIENTATION=+